MNINDLQYFIFNDKNRELFIKNIKIETDNYEKCLIKSGASCHIVVDGEGRFDISVENVKFINEYLINCDWHVRDYILNGILLDDRVLKNESVFELLDSLTSDDS